MRSFYTTIFVDVARKSKTAIEWFGCHPFVTGLLALLAILGLVLSLVSYQQDRKDARDTTRVVTGVGQQVADIDAKIAEALPDRRSGWDIRREAAETALARTIPKNITQLLRPGTSLSFMKEVLGQPHRQGPELFGALRSINRLAAEFDSASLKAQGVRHQYGYIFSNVWVQIITENGENIEELIIYTFNPAESTQLVLYPTDLVLGLSELDPLRESEEEGYDSSTKHSLSYVRHYYGASGNYFYYYYGRLLIAPHEDLTYEPGIVNYFAVTSSRQEGAPYLDWMAFE